MGITLQDVLVIAISSRALFNFEDENRQFDPKDDSTYRSLQLERLEQPALPGVAYPLIKKLLKFNTEGFHRVEVVVLSRNDPVSGLRVFRSARAATLPLKRGVFTRGRPPFRYLVPLNASLFLSANAEDVRNALFAGFPAAKVFPESAKAAESHPGEVRIAFDGDAVLFGDESEALYRSHGLDAFEAHEAQHVGTPLAPGPFKPFLAALHRLQAAAHKDTEMKIRTALVTARSAPAHERAIRTLRSWGIDVDEAMFLGGLEKGPFLAEFEPDFFFDDQTGHCTSAVKVSPTGHVDSGVANL